MIKHVVAVPFLAATLTIGSAARADEPSAAAPAPAVTPAAATAPVAAEPAPAKPTKPSVGPIVTIVAGGVGTLVGLGMLSLASTKEDQAKASDTGDSGLAMAGMSTSGSGAKQRQEADSLRSTGTIVAAGGLLVVAGGLTWLAIDRMLAKSAPAKAAALRITPAFGPSGGGAAVVGTF